MVKNDLGAPVQETPDTRSKRTNLDENSPDTSQMGPDTPVLRFVHLLSVRVFF